MKNQEPSRWSRWHEGYDDPGSSLARRLAVVQSQIRRVVSAAPAGPVRLLSVCAGQGRDVVGALRGHPRVTDVTGRLIELDPNNVAVARAALAAAGLSGLEVLEADAGWSDSHLGAVPADLVLLAGIFGNVSDDDIANTVRNADRLCAEGAHLIWTRHRRPPDLTPAIRRWFRDAGFEEVAFDAPADASFAVGVARLDRPPRPATAGLRLFTFT